MADVIAIVADVIATVFDYIVVDVIIFSSKIHLKTVNNNCIIWNQTILIPFYNNQI